MPQLATLVQNQLHKKRKEKKPEQESSLYLNRIYWFFVLRQVYVNQ